MSHYWAADEPQAVRKAQLADWIDDLREFPAAIVAQAVAEWRRAQSKRPAISDIRFICKEMTPPRRPTNAPLLTDERPEQRRAMVEDYENQRRIDWREAAIARDAWAQARGWASYRDWMTAGFDGRRRYFDQRGALA